MTDKLPPGEQGSHPNSVSSLPSTVTSSAESVRSTTSSGSNFPPPNWTMPSDFNYQSSGRTTLDTRAVVDSESGRTFHHDDDKGYFLPNDGQEQDRLDIQHNMFRLMLDDKLSWAPMESSPEYVLDVATGTGIWAYEFAEENPTSHVIGSDISKIQPDVNLKVPNVEWVIDDAEKEWLYPHVPGFDYIHIRLAVSCFRQPELVMRQAYQHMRPGGWIEYHEAAGRLMSPDGSHKGCAMERVNDLAYIALQNTGRDPDIGMKYKEMLERVGFVDVEQKQLMMPTNTWPDDPKWKQVGEYCLYNLYHGARGVFWKMLRANGMEPLEIESLISDYRNDLRNPLIHAYWRIYVVYGRKPPDTEVQNAKQ